MPPGSVAVAGEKAIVVRIPEETQEQAVQVEQLESREEPDSSLLSQNSPPPPQKHDIIHKSDRFHQDQLLDPKDLRIKDLEAKVKELKAEIEHHNVCEKKTIEVWGSTGKYDDALPIHYRQKDSEYDEEGVEYRDLLK
ncbi:hypothetical protein CYMTET_10670 [Cymbomonas tetramitiformis]|uniref:Uncharacterized protein n=1 Tax=Cymbomonas tetramitiformis TaxID=36881 RepID=A0AAE0LE86_9CHLO|nr:hypothetical protein CYMTET_10670 [Cymbomonas tetramitiformis]